MQLNAADLGDKLTLNPTGPFKAIHSLNMQQNNMLPRKFAGGYFVLTLGGCHSEGST